ncbi:MAG: hypothetical protein U5J99_09305 [Parvularculaceae bacterium]|nr:hypothetical protein [Parvularculaceae bacterium]
MKTPSLKTAVLAAASFAAIGAAAPLTAGAAPYEPAPIEHAAAADHGDAEARAADVAVKRWLAGGAVAAALAGLIQIFGWSRISASLKRAGSAAMAAPAAAARYVGNAVKSPFRFALLAGGLSLFALTGVGLYDVEWIGGMAVGATIALVGAFGAAKISKMLVRR